MSLSPSSYPSLQPRQWPPVNSRQVIQYAPQHPIPRIDIRIPLSVKESLINPLNPPLMGDFYSWGAPPDPRSHLLFRGFFSQSLSVMREGYHHLPACGRACDIQRIHDIIEGQAVGDHLSCFFSIFCEYCDRFGEFCGIPDS